MRSTPSGALTWLCVALAFSGAIGAQALAQHSTGSPTSPGKQPTDPGPGGVTIQSCLPGDPNCGTADTERPIVTVSPSSGTYTS